MLAFVMYSTVLVAAAVAARQVRDNTPVVAGTASISGTVLVDGAATQPARRVRVTLTELARATPGQTTTTDDNGAFAFRGVPPGRFELQAFKAGYLRTSYGASRPERAGTPIVVKGGEPIADLTMTIARGGVITGVVRNMRGQPLPGVNVRVLKFGYHAVTGERTLTAPSASSASLTDDRGEYRAFGLPPGGYVVAFAPPPGRGGGSPVDDIRQLSADEVRQALQTARSGAAGPLSAPSPAAPSKPETRLNYATIFHPGVTDIAAAATIALGLSEERMGVDITTQLVRTATISGTITSPTGALPPSLSIRLVAGGAGSDLLAGAGIPAPSTAPRADGTYVIGGVAPGTYTVKALIGRGRGAPADGPTMWASAEIVVNGQDLDVPLTLQPGVPINGRVVFEGAQPTPAELQSLMFSLVPPGSGGAPLSTGGGRVNEQGRFTFASITPDTYQYVTAWSAPGVGNKWTIKSSTANGRDAFEAPLRVDPNAPVDWTITFTDKPTTLTGVLQDRGGRAATDYYILVFSSDRKDWTPGARRVRMTRPATDGAFDLKGLPPGEYFVAALTDLEPGEWNDPTLLERALPTAVKVTLRDGETTRQDFRIGGVTSGFVVGR
jgi:hypothetical protein